MTQQQSCHYVSMLASCYWPILSQNTTEYLRWEEVTGSVFSVVSGEPRESS